jgi:CheY-like chemotaxis protein
MNPNPICDALLPPSLSILVVEDEMMTAMYMEDVLTELGCRVATAARIDKGLDIIRAQRIEGAFLDVSVFGAPIAPVVQELRDRGIPFAFVTGYDPAHLPADYRTHPILSKPVVDGKLAEVLAGFAARPPGAAAPAE